MHDDDAVSREVNVELEAVGSERHGRCRRPPWCSPARGRCRRDGRTPVGVAMKERVAHERESTMRSCYRIDPWRPLRPSETCGGPGYRSRPVKQEIRDNLVRKLQAGETLFPGIIGYDDTVVPQLVNAVLSRHNFILLGLRGQAKSRILRGPRGSARRADPGRAGLRDPRRSAGAAVRVVPRPHREGGRRAADRLAGPRRALRREARDART